MSPVPSTVPLAAQFVASLSLRVSVCLHVRVVSFCLPLHLSLYLSMCILLSLALSFSSFVLPFMRTPQCTFHFCHTFTRRGAPCMLHVASHHTVCTFCCSSNAPLVATSIVPFILPFTVPFRCWFHCMFCAFRCTFILHVPWHPSLYLPLHRLPYLSSNCSSVRSRLWVPLPTASTHALASAPLPDPSHFLSVFVFFFCRACASGNHLEVMRLSPGNL